VDCHGTAMNELSTAVTGVRSDTDVTSRKMVYVIVLNWNGAKDTIACVNSLFTLASSDYQVVVCDNASSDNSIEQIRHWAAGKSEESADPPRSEAHDAPGRESKSRALLELPNDPTAWRHPSLSAGTVVLIHTGSNLGYAGGNNVGIRYAQERGDADFFWILNNDTTVTPSALTALLVKASSDAGYGIVGSTLLYHYRPEYVQVLGGCSFSAWTTRVTPVGWGKTAIEAKAVSESAVESQLDYVAGASMLVSKAFIDDVGLMQEDYFLYYEEIDWAERGARSKKQAWRLGFAHNSVVFHKVGASAGTGASTQSTRQIYTSKIRFMKRFYPNRNAVTVLMVLMQAVKSLFTNHPGHALVILSVVLKWRSIAPSSTLKPKV
jgi:GT2 family glycosyltransferase